MSKRPEEIRAFCFVFVIERYGVSLGGTTEGTKSVIAYSLRNCKTEGIPGIQTKRTFCLATEQTGANRTFGTCHEITASSYAYRKTFRTYRKTFLANRTLRIGQPSTTLLLVGNLLTGSVRYAPNVRFTKRTFGDKLGHRPGV